MMGRSSTHGWRMLSAALALGTVLTAAQAFALPAFARKYGMSCTACHEAWPKLNAQGWNFRDQGYQWGAGKDSPIKLDPAYWPIAYRQTVGYQFTSTTNQATAAGPHTIRTGRIGISGVDLLFVGTLTNNVSFLFTYEPLLTNANFGIEFPNQGSAITNPGEGGYFESAWVRFDNLLGTPFLNLKVGRGALDLAFDEHRSFFIFNNSYAVYHFHTPGSYNPFELGTNQWQLSLEGHNERSTFRYALTYFQTQNDPGSEGLLASPGVFGHVQYTFFPAHKGLAELRLGLFGVAGSFATQAQYSAPDMNGNTSGPIAANPTGIVANTAFDNAPYFREGLDIDLKFVQLATPLDLRILAVAGQENRKLSIYGSSAEGLLNPQQDAMWAGGLAELDWTPVLNFTLALRYDFARNTQQVDTTPGNLPLHEGDIDNMGLSARYQIDIIPRAGTALTVELDRKVGYLSAFGGNTSEEYIAFGGLDFAF